MPVAMISHRASWSLLGLCCFLGVAACGPPESNVAAPVAPVHVGGDPHTPATGVASAGARAPAACDTPAACEARASAKVEALRHDPAGLAALLHRFPKGGDLHNHLAGAVYAESYLAWAREDGLRLDDRFTLVDASKCSAKPATMGETPKPPPQACSEVPASPADPRYDAAVRAFSMKDFQPGAESGHDHFFAAFSRFGLVSHEKKREAPMLAETMRRAADEGAVYLEVLVTAVRPLVSDIAKAAGTIDPHDLGAFVQRLHADGRWGELVTSSREALAELERGAREVLRCDKAEAPAACGLTVRYLGQVGRTSPASLVFAELLANFEVSQADARLAGVNLVSPEDNATALADYDLQMSMIGFLGKAFRGRSPARITLHAGELTSAIVPAANLEAHVRHAVEIAQAERIGHGVDVLSERDAPGLLAEMAARGVTVEICLSSNATILGVSGRAHPLSAYLAAGVPVVLATDDAGVSRSSLTGELVRAVTVQGLGYPELKAMARRSLTAAFLPGPSLWASPKTPVAACSAPAGSRPSPACSAFLASSPRAALEWQLEGQLEAFERAL
jgi:hypothetical protein